MINHCLANCLYSAQELRQDYTAIHKTAKTAWLLLELSKPDVVFWKLYKNYIQTKTDTKTKSNMEKLYKNCNYIKFKTKTIITTISNLQILYKN